jgi:hypothetical protein
VAQLLKKSPAFCEKRRFPIPVAYSISRFDNPYVYFYNMLSCNPNILSDAFLFEV